MYIKRFFTYLVATIVLSGCSVSQSINDGDWSISEDTPVGHPSSLEYGQIANMYGSAYDDGTKHQIAVLLPLSGANAQIGKTIRTSVEISALQNSKPSLSISFFDTAADINSAINDALLLNPDIIIGPLFANDARILRDAKPSQLPVLSFTSDTSAVGDGVMSVALMPTNSVEEIVKQIKTDDIKNFIIIAPDTNSGHLMAGTAKNAANIYELPLSGIFFYTEKDSDSIKNAALDASMYNARTAAHTRARQVLSDILTNEKLSPIEKSNLNTQLEKLEKTETVGSVPYDAVLFLGNGDDTKSLASFLRYYNINSRDAAFYGTPMWEGTDITTDYTLSGAKYASMPQSAPQFVSLYEQISGVTPNRLASFGFDATNMAINMIYSKKTNAEYLLNPSGYIGTDGLFRLKPTGDNERALRIMQLNGTDTATETRPAQNNFITPLYNIEQQHIEYADRMEMQTDGIDPDDYIRLPERLRTKYRSTTIGTNQEQSNTPTQTNIVTIQSDDTTITSAEFESAKPEAVKRTYIDEYEVTE